MPSEAKQFVHSIKRHAMHDIDRTRIGANTAMEQSLFSVGSMGGEVSLSMILNQIFQLANYLHSTVHIVRSINHASAEATRS